MSVRPRTRLAAMVVGVVLAACSAAGDSASDVTATTTSAAQPPTTESAPPTSDTTASDTTAPGEGPVAAASLVELRDDLGLEVLVLDQTTDTSSHPTLSWQPANGATSYWLVVRDADGRAFWAWTGPDTSVRVGGGDTPDTNQTAAVHEDMTWRVAAFDADGRLVALSDDGQLSP